MSPQQVERLICYLVVVLSIHARHVPQNDEVETERNVASFRLYSALRARAMLGRFFSRMN